MLATPPEACAWEDRLMRYRARNDPRYNPQVPDTTLWALRRSVTQRMHPVPSMPVALEEAFPPMPRAKSHTELEVDASESPVRHCVPRANHYHSPDVEMPKPAFVQHPGVLLGHNQHTARSCSEEPSGVVSANYAALGRIPNGTTADTCWTLKLLPKTRVFGSVLVGLCRCEEYPRVHPFFVVWDSIGNREEMGALTEKNPFRYANFDWTKEVHGQEQRGDVIARVRVRMARADDSAGTRKMKYALAQVELFDTELALEVGEPFFAAAVEWPHPTARLCVRFNTSGDQVHLLSRPE